MHDSLGIDRNRLEPTIDLLKDYLEVLHESFSNISDCVELAGQAYSGDGYDSFKKKADTYIFNFSIIEGNVQSYIDDLTNLLNNYINFEASYKVSSDE